MREETDAVKPPLALADLCENQIILVAMLAYGDEFEMGDHKIEAKEIATVMDFKGPREGTHRLTIFYDFDVAMMIWLDGQWKDAHVCNQRAIQKLFTEWGAE